MKDEIKAHKEKFLTGWRTVLICKKCKDKIFSRYSGEFVMCKCDTIFIDETMYGARIGGEMGDMEVSRECLRGEQ